MSAKYSRINLFNRDFQLNEKLHVVSSPQRTQSVSIMKTKLSMLFSILIVPRVIILGISKYFL